MPKVGKNYLHLQKFIFAMKEKNENDEKKDINDEEEIFLSDFVSDSYLVKQSYKLTKLKYDITRTEKNIFLKVVELCQKYEKGESMEKGCSLEMIVGKMSGKESPEITFPIKDLITNTHRNYELYRAGLKSLAARPFHMPDEEWDFTQINLFERVQGSEKKGVFKVKMTESFWDLFHAKGAFKYIDTGVAYKFKSVFSARMYDLLVGNKTRQGFKMDHIMSLFGKESYKPSNFLRKVIDVAEKELKEMEACPFYFEYTIKKNGKKFDLIFFDVINKQNNIIQKDQENTDKEKSKSVDDQMVKKELNEKVKNFVISFFEVEEISSSIEEKLLGLQNIIGTDALLKGLKKVYLTMQDLDLKTTPAGYLNGSLKNMMEKALYQQKKVDSVKKTAVDVSVTESTPGTTDPDIVDITFFENKAALAEISVEDMIKAYNAEKVDDNKYKIKR